MSRKPSDPDTTIRLPGGEKSLAVKDGLREVRFHVKQGARKLVQAVEAATHRGNDEQRGPLGLLGEPLNLAVRTTAQFLSSVDHAAVDAITSEGPYRAMTVQLRSSASYIRDSGSAADLRDFTTDHHWRYRHWLEMSRISDVFVHEQAIAIACAHLAGALPARTPALSGADAHALATANAIQALRREPILERPALLSPGDDGELAELNELGAVVVVLAGEVAVQFSAAWAELGARERYVRAVRLADEIAMADRATWKAALATRTPAEALGRWLGFVLRHV